MSTPPPIPQAILDYLAQNGVPPWQASAYLAWVSGYSVPGQGAMGVSGNGAIGMYPTDTGADALVGNAVELTPEQPSQSIAMPAGFRSSNNKVLNITFSVIDVQYPDHTTFFRNSVVGRLQFGAGGGAHEVEVDIKHGTQLSIVGQSPSLAARLEDALAPGTPKLVKLAASFGVGTRAARAFNTRTLPPVTVGPQLALYAQVPPFAYKFTPFCDDPVALGPGASKIEFWSYAGPVKYSVGNPYGPTPPIALTGAKVASFNGSDFAGARLSEGMTLPQGADLITITNLLGTNVTWTPCFTLSI